MDEALSARRLAWLAGAGVALTVVVVAASALLRLGTTLDAGGNIASELPLALQKWVRLAHRVSASGVALVALAALVTAFASRAVLRARAAALAAVVAFTAMLAIVGPITPGYRFTSVTIANALGGIALACAFVWLRGTVRAPPDRTVSAAAFAALAVLLTHAALGTAASAASMHGERALDPWHVMLGPAVVAIAVAAAACRHRAFPALRLRWTIFALAAAQMALGVALAAASESRALAWTHAIAACALALALTALSVAARRIAPA